MKKELRKLIRSRKSQHSASELAAWSRELCAQVIADGLWRSVGTVLLYHALADEVDTQVLLDSALRLGKRVLLPVVVGDDLILRRYTGSDDLQTGAYGIKEPVGDCFPQADYGQIDFVLVPGMAFDAYGHRLGRGKGYYDRLLPRLRNAYRVGICFPFQLLDSVPSEDHDAVVSEVISTIQPR